MWSYKLPDGPISPADHQVQYNTAVYLVNRLKKQCEAGGSS